MVPICTYVPPEGNQYYNYYDCDLFDLLESDLELYSGFAKVGVIGDLNTRLGLLDDIIRNDDVHQTLIDNMESLFLYPRDDLFVERNSKDNHVNNHGRKFITLCKESGLRIINGRTKSDQYGDITFQNRQRTSVIDIACIHYSSFNIVKDFAVEEFTEFSDHAPICLSLKVCAADGDNLCTCAQRSDAYVSWNSEAAEQLYQCTCILVNRDSLAACAENIEDINRSVQDFTNNLREITDHFCLKSFKTTDICETCKIKGRTTQNDNPNRPWFDEECAKKYSVYKKALSTFNRNRSHFNRLYLANKKAEYKSHIIKA